MGNHIQMFGLQKNNRQGLFPVPPYYLALSLKCLSRREDSEHLLSAARQTSARLPLCGSALENTGSLLPCAPFPDPLEYLQTDPKTFITVRLCILHHLDRGIPRNRTPSYRRAGDRRAGHVEGRNPVRSPDSRHRSRCQFASPRGRSA